MKILSQICILVLLYTGSSFGAISVDSISFDGHSTASISSAGVVVYGGFAGEDSSASPYTNCLANAEPGANGPRACNERRVLPTGTLTIYFKSDNTDGYPILTTEADKTTTVASGALVSKGSFASISVLWSTICDKLEISGCTGNASKAFRIGIASSTSAGLSSSSETYQLSIAVLSSMANIVDTASGTSSDGSNGVTNFKIFPGDEKFYVKDLETHEGFPTGPNSVTYSGIRFYYIEVDAACYQPDGSGNSCAQSDSVKNNSTYDGSNISFTTGTDPELQNDRFNNNIKNDSVYIIKSAIVDPAGNVGMFTSNSECTDEKHVVKPGEVMGILAESQNCFIATAAYGSRMEPEVQTFRNFRDQILVNTSLGRKMVLTYYKWSPKIGAYIAKHEKLREATRFGLWPVLGFAKLSLKVGPAYASMAAITMCFFPFLFIQVYRRRRRSDK